VADIDLRVFGGSALTAEISVPRHEHAEDLTDEIPVTYVPARNTIFLSYALAWAEVLESSDVFIGVNALDYSGYPDCRPEYISAYEQMANLATKAGVVERFGLQGFGAHSADAEYVLIDSIEPRLYLVTRMVMDIARGKLSAKP
jgi:7-cyano-7-deazaguanine synthase in queuosine biosynthesis